MSFVFTVSVLRYSSGRQSLQRRRRACVSVARGRHACWHISACFLLPLNIVSDLYRTSFLTCAVSASNQPCARLSPATRRTLQNEIYKYPDMSVCMYRLFGCDVSLFSSESCGEIVQHD